MYCFGVLFSGLELDWRLGLVRDVGGGGGVWGWGWKAGGADAGGCGLWRKVRVSEGPWVAR